MNLRLFFLLMLSSIILVSAAGQKKISGTVVDMDTKEIIEYANIALLKQDSAFVAGASSDLQGLFAFADVPNGNYLLSVTFVGYGNRLVPVDCTNNDVEVGSVELALSDVALQDVTIIGNTVIQKPDKKIIIPSAAQVNASNSGVTLLRNLQLSRIVVNPISNVVTVPGGDAVQLRINGVEVTIAEVVALQPSDIIRIEYHDEPGMRYGTAAAVIDYITRRKESGGSLNTNISNVFFYDMDWGENFLSGKVNHKKSEFGVNAYWARRGIKWTRENEERFVFPDKMMERIEEGLPTRFEQDRLNLAFNYNLNETDKYLFNATFRLKYNDTPREFTDRESTILSSENKHPLKVLDHSTWKSNTPSLDLYYQRKLKNDQLLIFNVVGTYIDSRSTRLYQESMQNELITDIYSSIVGDKYSLIAEGIYEKTLKSSKLSAGLKHTQSYTKNGYQGNTVTNVGMNFAETYAYLEYQLRKGKFNYAFGMGLMRTYNGQGGESNQKYIPRPTLRVSYNINDNAYIRYNGFVSGYSPSLSDLNNVQQDIDAIQVRRGNPDLKTVLYHSSTLNAGYNKGIFGAEFYMRYSYDHEPIMEEISFDNDLNKFVRTNVNHKGFHRMNTQLTLKLKPWKEYITLSVSPGLNRYISVGNDFTHTYNNWRVSASLMANYKNWNLVTEWMPRWNNYWGETKNLGEEVHMVSVGYNTKKWGLSLIMLNPFSGNYSTGSENYSKLAPSISNVYTKNLGQIAVINFSMNLNFGRQYKSTNKRLNNDDTDAGIMKGSK